MKNNNNILFQSIFNEQKALLTRQNLNRIIERIVYVAIILIQYFFMEGYHSFLGAILIYFFAFFSVMEKRKISNKLRKIESFLVKSLDSDESLQDSFINWKHGKVKFSRGIFNNFLYRNFLEPMIWVAISIFLIFLDLNVS